MNAARSVILLGAGGFAREVAEAIQAGSQLKLVGFFDDNPALADKRVGGAGYLGRVADYLAGHAPGAAYFIAMGDNRRRAELDQAMQAAGRHAEVIIHPSAVVSPAASLGGGGYVGAGCFLGPQVSVGRCALINVHSSIGHDAVLGDYVQLCPGARVSGGCHLEQGAFVGSNAVLAPRCGMKPWARLAAASFAATTIPADSLALGVPARIVSRPAAPSTA